jgi:hypothetical protein
MRAATLLFLGLVAGSAAAAADTPWSWVSASDPARAVDAVPSDPPPGEEVVRFIPATVRPPPEAVGPRPVRAVALPEPAEDSAGPAVPVPADAIPAEALWPDREGAIAEARPSAVPAERNPWEARAKAKAKVRTESFTFGGYIAGGPAGPVGLVNGRGRRKGEEVGGFTVVRIAPAGVVLARGGALYVVPPRRQVTIELSTP